MKEAPREPSADELLARVKQVQARGLRAVLLTLVGVAALGLLLAPLVKATLLTLIVTVGGTLAICLVGVSAHHTTLRARLEAARQLLAGGHYLLALGLLKELARAHDAEVKDEASYLTAYLYDKQRERALAIEGYRTYLDDFRRGSWVVEARARLRELDPEAAERSRGLIPTVLDALGMGSRRPAAPAPAPARPEPAVRAVPAVQAGVVCAFCRDAIDSERLTAECATCGTAHHLACYEEQGGCSVYGCTSRKVKSRVREGE